MEPSNTMIDGKHCPACGQDIGLWAVLLAAWPSLIRCPHCKARLSYGRCVPLVVILIASLAALFFAVHHYYALSDLKFHVIYLGLALAIVAPLDVAATIFLRQRGVLRKRD